MLIVDVNLLIYAINRDAVDHARAKAWWEGAVSGNESVGLAWAVVLAFIRITTSPRVMAQPLSFEQAAACVDEWLEQPTVAIAKPTERHWGILRDLLGPLGSAGNLTSDAHLAALAIEHGATLVSADRDFGQFPHLRWRNPLA